MHNDKYYACLVLTALFCMGMHDDNVQSLTTLNTQTKYLDSLEQIEKSVASYSHYSSDLRLSSNSYKYVLGSYLVLKFV